jgi:DNA/RNA-binding domain of Phe-tRNA-synthetase-like protein
MNIELEDDVKNLIRLGSLTLTGYRAGPTPSALDRLMQIREEEIRQQWAGATAGSIPELQVARRLYRAAGLDPTRTRPSSEALVRRILRGDPLPRINAAVDLCNLSAISYFLPIGLYDAGKIVQPIRARLGQDHEHYEGLGKPRVNLHGRFCLVDAHGPFGNPSSDSRRTAVDQTTRNLLWVNFVPLDHEPDRLARHLLWSGELARKLDICSDHTSPVLVPARETD